MPVKSGVSHVLASVAALLVAPVAKEMWTEIFSGSDVSRAIAAAGVVVAEHPFVPVGENVVSLSLTVVTIVVLVYVHGHLYHVGRHGSE